MNTWLKILFGLSACWYSQSIPMNEPVPVDILLTGLAVHKDEQGCCESCGYKYCPSLDDCVRPWETYCQEFDFPYNALWEGSGITLPLKKDPEWIIEYNTEQKD